MAGVLQKQFTTNNTPMQYQQASNTSYEDEDIDLMELLDQFLSKWRWWMAGLLLGGLMGLVAAFVIPPKYEAQGILRLAQVGSPGVEKSTPIESSFESIARMQTLAFRNDVVDRLVKQSLIPEAERAQWIEILNEKSLVKPVKEASYIEVRVSAKDQELGKAVISILTQVLAERHQPLVDEKKQAISKSLEQTQTALNEMEKRYGSAASLTSKSSTPSNSLNYLELARMSEAGTYASLRQRLLELETAMQAPATRPTELVEAVAVSDKPVSPKKSLLVAGGLLMGGMLGTLLGFGLPAWRQFQASRKTRQQLV